MILSLHVGLLALAIGLVCGLRSLVTPAVIAWSARLGWLKLASSTLYFVGSLPVVIFFTLFGVIELVIDKLPQTPSRTAAPGLIARFMTGALCGASVVLGSSAHGVLLGAILGAVGGILGAFLGYLARTQTVKAFHLPDIAVALAEDAITIVAALLIVLGT